LGRPKKTRYRAKRVYEAPDAGDGLRVLVDRLWPRGVSKAAGKVDLWLRDIAPSDRLRKEFHAQPEKWTEFLKAYAKELEGEAAQAALGQLRAQEASVVTLLYAAKDEEKNNAAALKAWLEP
jgi:uncharacterized protein YeaO (DUF488 family)